MCWIEQKRTGAEIHLSGVGGRKIQPYRRGPAEHSRKSQRACGALRSSCRGSRVRATGLHGSPRAPTPWSAQRSTSDRCASTVEIVLRARRGAAMTAAIAASSGNGTATASHPCDSATAETGRPSVAPSALIGQCRDPNRPGAGAPRPVDTETSRISFGPQHSPFDKMSQG